MKHPIPAPAPTADRLIIRPGASADIPDLMDIHYRGWRRAYGAFLKPERIAEMRPGPKREGFWRKALADPRQTLLVAAAGPEAGSEILGFLLGGPIHPHEILTGSPVGHDREIYAFHVREASGGRGIGYRLFGEAASLWRQAGSPGFMLWCFAANPYRRFYEKCGGRIIAEGRDEGAADIAFGWPIDSAFDNRQEES